MNIEKIINEMTLEDKIAFCTGADMWHTKAMEKYGIPDIMMTDGPHGLRCQKNTEDNLGLNDSLPATCFPTAVTAGNSWNPKMMEEVGKAIAEEAKEYGVSIVLGPGTNIKRNPLGGRNFEYFSEDPVLAGKLSAGMIKGVQSQGIGTSLKHFACNNQEYKRQNGSSIVDERALHEIYLKPFEIAVREAHPSTVMCSYNQINGVYSSDNRYLLSDLLRNEWGFDGAVITDWGAMADRIKGFEAGCDLNMPGGSKYMEKDVIEAVRCGKLDEERINDSVRRILKLVEDGKKAGQDFTFDHNAHHELARKAAEEGAVLLKNEDHILPLKKEKVCLIGSMAEDLRYQGSGSSHINPIRLTQMKDIWNDVPYAEGVDEKGSIIRIDEAIQLAKQAETAVIFMGLPASYESEAYDRDHMRMPQAYTVLVNQIARVNPNIVAVIFGGSAMEIPFADKVKAILYMGLPGEAGAEAAAELLEGKVNPSGKLSETWPLVYGDTASKETFGKKYTEYRESIYVGYRYYDKAQKDVRFRFGSGLSYTDFSYANLKVKDGTVSVDVTNTGNCTGKEIVQLYVSSCDQLYRCIRDLKAFEKIELEPSETKTVTFEIRDDFFEVWQDGFVKAAGDYMLQICSDCSTVLLEAPYHAEGKEVHFEEARGTWYEKPAGLPSREQFEKIYGKTIADYKEPERGSFTMDSTCAEMKDSSLVMKIQYLVTKAIVSNGYSKEEQTMDNPAYRMIVTAATDCPIRAAVISSNGAMSDELAHALLDMANGHFFKGLKKMLLKK